MMLRWSRTYDRPWRSSSIMRCVRAAGRCLMCSDINATMTTRKDRALRLKQAAKAVISRHAPALEPRERGRARSGPTMRATLN